MPAVVACPKCKKRFNLPDNLLGKPVKCTACATTFRTPAPRAAGSPAQRTVDPQQAARQQQAAAEARRKAAELQKMGVDGPLRQTPDIFDGLGSAQGTPDPLNNVVLEDPGFADVNSPSAAMEEEAEDPQSELFQNPALQVKEKPKKKMAAKKKKKRKRKGEKPWTQQPWFLITAIFLPLFAISAILSLTGLIPWEISRIVLGVIALPLLLAGPIINIWGLVIVANETDTLQVVLCLFIPLYILYPIITHWQAMKNFVFASLAYTGVMIFGLLPAFGCLLYRIAQDAPQL